jgi:hypothetical protein
MMSQTESEQERSRIRVVVKLSSRDGMRSFLALRG